MKRLLATALWFYSFWYLGSMLSALFGIPDLLGPILGISAAAFIGIDPRRALWAARQGEDARRGKVAVAA